jgi:hypothetical protein
MIIYVYVEELYIFMIIYQIYLGIFKDKIFFCIFFYLHITVALIFAI